MRLGILTPSSNTALEPITSALVAQQPQATAHFARLRVTTIGLSSGALGQFDIGQFLPAARLLADAQVDAIGWSGTAAGWMGFAQDEALCRLIKEQTGIPATTAVLALNQSLRRAGVKKLGIVSPYTNDVQSRICSQYERAGFEVISAEPLEISDNFSFALVSPQRILEMGLDCAARGAQAVVPFCTNLNSAGLAQEFEIKTGALWVDTVSVTVWGLLRLLQQPTQAVVGWGKLFSLD